MPKIQPSPFCIQTPLALPLPLAFPVSISLCRLQIATRNSQSATSVCKSVPTAERKCERKRKRKRKRQREGDSGSRERRTQPKRQAPLDWLNSSRCSCDLQLPLSSDNLSLVLSHFRFEPSRCALLPLVWSPLHRSSLVFGPPTNLRMNAKLASPEIRT